MPTYDGLLLRYINLQRVKDEEMARVSQEMNCRLGERDSAMQEEKEHSL